jgi:hypothetical protein
MGVGLPGDPVTNGGLVFECSAVRSAGPRIRPAGFKRARGVAARAVKRMQRLDESEMGYPLGFVC